jgi:hypothetical protein
MEGAGRRNFDSATLFPSLSTQERTACREQPERRASIGAGLEVQYAQPIVGGREGREKACATPSVWTLVSIDAAMRSPRWHGVVMSFTLCDMRQLLQSTCSSAGELLSWALGHGRSERPATTIDCTVRGLPCGVGYGAVRCGCKNASFPISGADPGGLPSFHRRAKGCLPAVSPQESGQVK